MEVTFLAILLCLLFPSGQPFPVDKKQQDCQKATSCRMCLDLRCSWIVVSSAISFCVSDPTKFFQWDVSVLIPGTQSACTKRPKPPKTTTTRAPGPLPPSDTTTTTTTTTTTETPPTFSSPTATSRTDRTFPTQQPNLSQGGISLGWIFFIALCIIILIPMAVIFMHRRRYRFLIQFQQFMDDFRRRRRRWRLPFFRRTTIPPPHNAMAAYQFQRSMSTLNSRLSTSDEVDFDEERRRRCASSPPFDNSRYSSSSSLANIPTSSGFSRFVARTKKVIAKGLPRPPTVDEIYMDCLSSPSATDPRTWAAIDAAANAIAQFPPVTCSTSTSATSTTSTATASTSTLSSTSNATAPTTTTTTTTTPTATTSRIPRPRLNLPPTSMRLRSGFQLRVIPEDNDETKC